MKKTISIAVLFVFNLTAQANPFFDRHGDHLIGVNAFYGFNTMFYKPTIGENLWGNGMQLELIYTWNFLSKEEALSAAQSFGIQLGTQFSYIENQFRISSYSKEYPNIDIDGDAYLHKTLIKNYREKLQMIYLNFPILLRYQIASFAFKIGPVFGFNLNTESHNTADLVKISGAYQDAVEDFENITLLGFVTQNTYVGNQKLHPDINLSGAFEASYIYRYQKLRIGIGLYAQYGFLPLFGKQETQNFLDVKMDKLNINSAFNSKLLEENDPIIPRAIPFSAGFKLTLGFRFYNKHEDQVEIVN